MQLGLTWTMLWHDWWRSSVNADVLQAATYLCLKVSLQLGYMGIRITLQKSITFTFQKKAVHRKLEKLFTWQRNG